MGFGSETCCVVIMLNEVVSVLLAFNFMQWNFAPRDPAGKEIRLLFLYWLKGNFSLWEKLGQSNEIPWCKVPL